MANQTPRARRIDAHGMLIGRADHARLATRRGWVRMDWRDLDRVAKLVDLSTQENHAKVAEILRARFSELGVVESHRLAVTILRAV